MFGDIDLCNQSHLMGNGHIFFFMKTICLFFTFSMLHNFHSFKDLLRFFKILNKGEGFFLCNIIMSFFSLVT